MSVDFVSQEQGSSDPKISKELPESSQSAYTFIIQSWATPIVGIFMLVIGLVGGYYGRPWLDARRTSPETSQVENTTSPNADQAARQQALMEAVVSETRHFRGDPEAPVTIIEFSDFK